MFLFYLSIGVVFGFLAALMAFLITWTNLGDSPRAHSLHNFCDGIYTDIPGVRENAAIAYSFFSLLCTISPARELPDIFHHLPNAQKP
jgi:hypothetical protein